MRNRYLLAADTAAALLCAGGAFILRLDWGFARAPEFAEAFVFFLVTVLLCKPPVLLAFGLYRQYWRYAGTRDLLRALLAVAAASAVVTLVISAALLTGYLPIFPRSILAIDGLLMAACVGGLRLSVRLSAESQIAAVARLHDGISTRRVLLAGAGDAGALVLREIKKNPQLLMQPVGFLDDDPGKAGKTIHDVPVLGPLASLAQVVQAREVDEVIVAMPSVRGDTIRSVLEACQRASVPARAVPGLFELLDGGLSIGRFRQIELADLLRRRPIRSEPETGLYLQGQTVLVTGAGGSIGAELCRQVSRAAPAQLILLGHGENSIFDIHQQLRQLHPGLSVHPVIADIRDPHSLRAVFQRYRPTTVFHAAAHKHVPLMETCPAEAVLNNIVGTKHLVDAAAAADVANLVLISTDKAVAPTSMMGASKRVAELIVRDAAVQGNRRFLAVRFGNVLGSRGSVVPLFKRQIEQGGPITVTHPDVRRFFMTMPEAVYLVLKAGGLAHGGELCVLDMGDPVRIADLARDLVRLSGLAADEIPIVYTGLRPGEKLDETLWEADSQVDTLEGADVFRVRERGSDIGSAALAQVVGELEAAARASDTLAIHGLLSTLLPTFTSSLALPAGESQQPPAGRASASGRATPRPLVRPGQERR